MMMMSETLLFNDKDLSFLLTIIIGLALLLPIVNVRTRRMLVSLVARQRVTWLSRQQHDDYAKVSGLFIYPVKSLRAVSLTSSKLDERGLVNDRRFMIICPNPPPLHGGPVDATHRFVTQRQYPALATSVATFFDSTLILTRGKDSVTVKMEMLEDGSKKYRARIWDDVVEVVDAGDEAAAFLQSIITERGVRLVAMSPGDPRCADDAYLPPEARTWNGGVPRVALSDGFPILIACTASLEELNRRLFQRGKDAIPMSRFRPNIVIETKLPFEEDTWKVIQIGDAVLHLVKGCPRCKQSCTDQLSGNVSEEPLVTLGEFRALGHSKEDVYFAQNAVPHDVGTTLTVGAAVKILKRGDPVWDRKQVHAE
jgi:uncharacterized protein YcbX